MKDVTVIRIARVTYEIEKNAKKDFSLYIKKLSSQLDDSDVLREIEIRITELLQQIGVTQGSMITPDDIKEIRSMMGEPKDFTELVVQKKPNRILIWLRRIGAVILLLSALMLIVDALLYEVSLNNSLPSNKGVYVSVGNEYMTSSILTVSFVSICFLSIVSLLFFISYLLFKNKFSKKIFIRLGVAFAALIILISSTAWIAVDEKNKSFSTYSNAISRSVSLPDDFSKISNLELDTPFPIQVKYEVGAPSMRLSHEQARDPKVTVSGDTAKIYLQDEFLDNGNAIFGPFVMTISGPKLTSITTSRGYLLYISPNQDTLSIIQKSLSHVEVDKSYIKNLSVEIQGQSVFSSNTSTVEKLNLSQKGETYVSVGNINSLTLTGQLACPTDTPSRLFIDNITDDKFMYNGSYVSTKTVINPCLEVRVGK